MDRARKVIVVAGGCVVVGSLLLGAAIRCLGARGGPGVPRPRWFAPSSAGVFHGFDGRIVWTDSTDPNAGLPVGK